MDPNTAGEPPLARVDLGPNHTHDLLLHLRLLGVDVSISYLAILISAHRENTLYFCLTPGLDNVPALSTALYFGYNCPA